MSAAPINGGGGPSGLGASGQSIPILGSLLDDILGKVNNSVQQAITAAQNAGDNMLVEAGRQINIAIQNAKIAYADSLTLTIDKVSKAISNQLDQINGMVAELQDKSSKDLDTLEGRAQQWINTLPFTNSYMPQLTSVIPRAVIIDVKAREALLQFSGNFVWASDPKYVPTLKFDDAEFKLANSTTQKLGYMVSFKNSSAHNATYVVGTLQVPWNKNSSWWPWPDNRIAEYKVWLKALPLCPGNIAVTYTSKTTKTVTQHYSSPNMHEDGNSDYPKDWVTRIDRVYPTPGWRFIPNSAVAKVTYSHGSDRVNITDRSDSVITCSIDLCCRDGKHMGIVDFHVEVDQCQEVTTTNNRTQAIDLKWGDSIILDPQAGEEVSKITFDAFDGTHSEFAGTDLSNPYLKVVNQAGKLQLKAVIPTEADLKSLKAQVKAKAKTEPDMKASVDSKKDEKRDVVASATAATASTAAAASAAAPVATTAICGKIETTYIKRVVPVDSKAASPASANNKAKSKK